MKYKWVLASASPRRKELLKMVIDDYTIVVSDREEKYTSEKPADIVKELAQLKGRAVAENVGDNTIVISADTIVCVDDKILGKPHDYTDAVIMLSSLSGKKHQVYTGVCVVCKNENNIEESIFSEVTDIYVDELTQEEIHDYIIKEEPYDKAGSYAIQGSFAKHISRICGDYNNVVGFPVHAFYKLIKEKGYIE